MKPEKLLTEIRDRGFGAPLLLPQTLRLEPRTLSKDAFGGPDMGRWKVTAKREEDLYLLFGLLRCPIVALDARRQPVWWGFINSVSGTLGKRKMIASLDEMYNRVKVVFQVETGSDAGARLETAWAENSDSITTYGYKEHVLTLSQSTTANAQHHRNLFLRDSAMPIFDPADAVQGEAGGEIIALGWLDTFDWRLLAEDSLACGSYTAIAGAANMKAQHGATPPYQSYVAPRNMTASVVRFYMRRTGQQDENGDWGKDGRAGRRALIRANNAGVTGSILAVSDSIKFNNFAYPNMDWHDFLLTSDLAQEQGQTYWVGFDRGPDDLYGADVEAAVDEGLGYAGGVLKLRVSASNHKDRVPNADMAFGVYGVVDSTEMMAEIIKVAGQFFSDFDIRSTSGLFKRTMLKDNVYPLTVLAELCKAGSTNERRMLMDVLEDRRLRIREEPESDEETDYTLLLDERGEDVLLDPDGQPVPPQRWPVGIWYRLGDPALRNPISGGPLAFFAERWEYDCEAGRAVYTPRGRPNRWDFGAVRAVGLAVAG